MALLLGIPVTISTLNTLIKLISTSGHVIHDAYGVTQDGITTMKSSPSRRLVDRCSAISEILQGIDHNILISNMGRKLVQTLVDCIAWAKKYDEKYKISKIIMNKSHKSKFKECHLAITQDFADISNTLVISSSRSKNPIKIEQKILQFSSSSSSDALDQPLLDFPHQITPVCD